MAVVALFFLVLGGFRCGKLFPLNYKKPATAELQITHRSTFFELGIMTTAVFLLYFFSAPNQSASSLLLKHCGSPRRFSILSSHGRFLPIRSFRPRPWDVLQEERRSRAQGSYVSITLPFRHALGYDISNCRR